LGDLVTIFRLRADDAYALGLIGKDKKPDLANIYGLGLLKQVLEERDISGDK
jgi:hypothetical protein